MCVSADPRAALEVRQGGLGLRLGLSFPHSMRQSRRPQGKRLSKQARETTREVQNCRATRDRPCRRRGRRACGATRELADRMQQMMDRPASAGSAPPSRRSSSEKPNLSESVQNARARARAKKTPTQGSATNLVQDGKCRNTTDQAFAATIRRWDGQSRAVEDDWLQLQRALGARLSLARRHHIRSSTGVPSTPSWTCCGAIGRSW